MRSSPSGPVQSIKGSVTLDHGSIPAAGAVEASVAFSGARPQDVVSVSPRLNFSNIAIFVAYACCRVDDTIIITLGNMSAGALDPAAMTYDVVVTRG